MKTDKEKLTLKELFRNIFKPRYRIVVDSFAGYEVQIKRWYIPIYSQLQFSNTHRTIEEATEFAKKHANKIYLDI